MVLSDVFISYSRKDGSFVATLNTALLQAEKKAWIDWKDIPYSSKWWDEISEAIQGANAFICIMTPDYFLSKTCSEELRLAEKLDKKIIPVLYKEFEPTLNNSNQVSKINWLFFRQSDDFSNSFNSLIDTINKDLDWVKFHTRLLVRAMEWSAKKNDSSYHLYGKDLEEALTHKKNEAGKIPQLNSLQNNYILASQTGAADLHEKQLRGFYLAALIYSFAQMFVIYIWSHNDLSETAMINLSWVWVPALSFAIAGFTIGKYSLKKSFFAMAVAVVLFFLFFEFVWASL